MNENKYFDVTAVIKLNELGGTGEYSDTADLDVINLMMKSEFVTIGEKTIRVQGIEVTDRGEIRFYGEEVKKDGTLILFEEL
ncbi:hypothetical protein KJK41_21980 (plasmid) [Bacillus haikouensis]|nr:hypothetical protein KJK41_21980 [Bacillus haikouensis]